MLTKKALLLASLFTINYSFLVYKFIHIVLCKKGHNKPTKMRKASFASF